MRTQMRLTKSLLKKWSLNEPESIVQGIGSICGDICVGLRGYGDYETSRINFAFDQENLRRLAAAILICVVGEHDELYFPFEEAGRSYEGISTRMARGIRIVVARQADIEFSFSYRPSRKLKRHPWYPGSLNCNELFDLPTFSTTAIPGQIDYTQSDNRRDLRRPYGVWIGGYPKGLLRLARLLLDYANTDIPPEEIDLEVEGGFRGVGPCSYEARFERIDD